MHMEKSVYSVTLTGSVWGWRVGQSRVGGGARGLKRPALSRAFKHRQLTAVIVIFQGVVICMAMIVPCAKAEITSDLNDCMRA